MIEQVIVMQTNNKKIKSKINKDNKKNSKMLYKFQ